MEIWSGSEGARVGGCEARLEKLEMRREKADLGQAAQLGMGNINKESSDQVKRKFQFHHPRDKAAATGVKWGQQQTSSSGVLLASVSRRKHVPGNK